MDPLHFLVVWLYFNGVLVREGINLQYVGGREEISHVENHSLSLGTIIANLKVH